MTAMRFPWPILLLFPCGAAFGQPSKVAFRDDHVILVDSKPLFPIGLYYCSEEIEDPSGKLLRQLRDYGFNTLGFYRWGQKDWRKELDRVHDAGFKVWIRGENGFAIDNAAIETAARDQVRQLRNHPALLFWEFQDEPILNKVSIENSKKGYALVKREDPDHPLLVVEWPGAVDRFHLWKGVGDIFATDLYPIPREKKYGALPNHDLTQMRDYLEALGKAHPGRPRLLVLQAWAWDPLKDGQRGYPTVLESRFMAYQAVIHGASGLFYYGQVHCTKPNSASALASDAKDPAIREQEFAKCLQLNDRFWKEHKPFFQELAKASAVFVLRNARPAESVRLVQQKPDGPPGIESLTKRDGQSLYHLAVNADSRARAATFRLPAADAGVRQVHVLQENRKLTVNDGEFTDEFRPYDTHVYSTAAEIDKVERR